MFEGIDSGVDPDPGSCEEAGMRGDLRTATVREFDDGPHVFRRPRRLFLLRSVQVELEEIRPVVELGRCGLEEGGAVIRFDREAPREDAAVADPGSRDPDPRSIRVRPPPFPHAERQGPLPSVPRIRGERGPDVAGPTHARAAQEFPIVLRDFEQFIRGIGPAVDPVRASGEGDVAVGVDHSRDDRRAACVDHVDVAREISFVRSGPDPEDAASVHEDAHALPKGGAAPVREGGVPVERRSGNHSWAPDGESRPGPNLRNRYFACGTAGSPTRSDARLPGHRCAMPITLLKVEAAGRQQPLQETI